MEGYTARDAIIVMRLDLNEALHEIDQEIAEVDNMLELSGIAEHMLRDDPSPEKFPAIRRWLETVSDRRALERDRDELFAERDEIVSALDHLEERLMGRSS